MITQHPHLARYQPPRPANDDSRAAESYRIPALICAFGFFMHMLLSEPTLRLLHIPYGGDEGNVLTKIHPGSYLILISFLVLICSRANPLMQIIHIARQHTAFFSLFAVYLMIAVYWLLRGPKGIGLIFDMHIVMPICALVFSYAPYSLCRKIVYAYAAFAVLNSSIGIFEGMTHTRILPYGADWEVTTQNYFRASALLGHPLNNAAFTAVSLFVVQQVRMPKLAKIASFLIMLISLIAFGARSSLIACLVGLIVVGLAAARKNFAFSTMTVQRLVGALLALLIVPAACVGILFAVLNSSMGERLMAYNSLQDESAAVRVQSWHAFDYLSPAEFVFGVDGDRISEIADHLGLAGPVSDIENPWILMFLFLGAIMFTLWFCALVAFMWRLAAGAPMSLKIAIIEYFLISATANSFGRKDPVFILLPGIIVCVKRLEKLESLKKQATYP